MIVKYAITSLKNLLHFSNVLEIFLHILENYAKLRKFSCHILFFPTRVGSMFPTRAGIHVYGIFLHMQEACFRHISEVMAYFSNLTITFTKLSLFILEYVSVNDF